MQHKWKDDAGDNQSEAEKYFERKNREEEASAKIIRIFLLIFVGGPLILCGFMVVVFFIGMLWVAIFGPAK